MSVKDKCQSWKRPKTMDQCAQNVVLLDCREDRLRCAVGHSFEKQLVNKTLNVGMSETTFNQTTLEVERLFTEISSLLLRKPLC